MKNKKIGLSPGTLIYTGKIKNGEVKVTSYSYNSESIKSSVITTYGTILHMRDNYSHWLDIQGVHNIDTISKLGEIYKIDNLILEDILNINQRPKFEEREDFIFLVMKIALLAPDENDAIEYSQISFILSSNFLLTFQEKNHHIFDEIINRLQNNIGKLRKRKENYLAYALLDNIIDHYFEVYEYFEEKLNILEEKIMMTPSKEDIEEIIRLKREIIEFRKNIYPIREIIFTLGHNEYFHEIRLYLKDLQDHSLIIHENTETIYNRALELVQLYHSSVGNNMNETMKVLTIISTIFIPLSFLTGIYGMNFQNMPVLSLKYGYYFILGVMALLVIIMVIYFKKKNWW